MEIESIDYFKYIQKAFNIKDEDACWCGSGKKYLECHKKISNSRKAQKGEIFNTYMLLNKNKMCLHPKKSECTGQIIDAHSIQNSRSIKSISLDGHVYAFELYNGLDDYYKYGTLLPKKIGVNNISVFKGFCSYHDKELFLEIDSKIIEPTPEQSILLSIRSMAKEIYLKIINSNNDKTIQTMQKGQNIDTQARIEELYKLHMKGCEIAVNDLYIHYNIFLEMNTLKNYDRLHRLVIKIDSVPEIMCSSIIHPVLDLNGNILQTLQPGKNVFDVISIEILSNGDDGIIQFCWHNNSKVCEQFVDSILQQPDVPNTILKLIFAFVENHAFSIQWWDNLSNIKKIRIMKYVVSNIYQGTLNMKDLVSDYRKYINWNILEIKRE